RCSLLPRQASEHERVADRLAELPVIHDAFSRGEISYGKVSTLARVAEPESEGELVRLAGVLTASQLERSVGAYRRLSREEAAEQQEDAFLSYHWTERGSLSLRGRLAPDDGAVVVQALAAGREAIRAQRETDVPVSNADALVAVADRALAGPGGDGPGGE